jgi:hypothetical protein
MFIGNGPSKGWRVMAGRLAQLTSRRYVSIGDGVPHNRRKADDSYRRATTVGVCVTNAHDFYVLRVNLRSPPSGAAWAPTRGCRVAIR